MASLADLKKLLTDVCLGSKEFNKAAELGNALKAYDPDLKIIQACVTQKIVNAMQARRAALAAKLNDLGQATAFNAHDDLEALGEVLDEMASAKVKKMTPEYLQQLNDARKSDLLRIETKIIAPMMDKFLKKHQDRYEFANGKLTLRSDEGDEDESEDEEPVDPKLLKRAEKDSAEIIDILAARDALLGAKSPLDAADLRAFTKDKLSFLPGAIRGGDTKKLLAEERAASDAAAEFEKARAKSLAIFNDAYENLIHNGKTVRSGPTPLFLWTGRAKFVAHRDSLVTLLGKLRKHLDAWFAQRTTARLDLKSKKVMACTRLAEQADNLVDAYQKLI